MGTLTANRFSIVWRWFQLLGVFQSFGIGLAFGATNETSSLPVSRVYCKAKHSAFKIAKEERMKESVVKYRSTIGRFFLVVRNLRVLHG